VSDRELLTECLDVLTHDAAQRTFAGGVRMSQLAIKLRAALAAPQPEPVAWKYVNSEGECEQIEYGTEAIDDDSITLLYAAPPAAAPEPEPESKTPAWWVDGLAVTLMREGVNKHRAREIAVGYWEAYCQIPGQEEVQP
jgi:hypothetical protein